MAKQRFVVNTTASIFLGAQVHRTFLLALLLSLFSTDAKAQTGSVDIKRVGSDFRILAPYLSMDGRVTLEILDAANVASKLTRIHEYANRDFSSHPLLGQVGKTHMQYLIASEARVIPVLRANEIEPEQLLAELFSRVVENQVLRAWQIELEDKCQAGYRSIVPVSRLLAAKPSHSDNDKLSLESANGTLSLVQSFEKDLMNVTLLVQFESITDDSIVAYYFIPEWKADEKYSIRVPARWIGIGADATIRSRIELLSDEHSTTERYFFLSENRDRAVSKALENASALAERFPQDAVQILDSLKGDLPDTKECAEHVRVIRKQAKDVAHLQIARYQLQLRSESAQMSRLRRNLTATKQTAAEREQLKSQLKSCQEQVDSINQTVNALRKVLR